MPVTVNVMGRIWGVVVAIWRQTAWFKKIAGKMVNCLPGMWLWGGAVATAWVTIWWNAIDSLLAAQVTLNSNWENVMNGAPDHTTIGEILSHANYYFPIDVLGQLTGIYLSVWGAVATVKAANKMVATLNAFKGAVFK